MRAKHCQDIAHCKKENILDESSDFHQISLQHHCDHCRQLRIFQAMEGREKAKSLEADEEACRKKIQQMEADEKANAKMIQRLVAGKAADAKTIRHLEKTISDLTAMSSP